MYIDFFCQSCITYSSTFSFFHSFFSSFFSKPKLFQFNVHNKNFMHIKSKYKETTIGCVSTIVLILIYRRWCHQRNCRNSVEPAKNSRTRIHNHMSSVHHQLERGSNNNNSVCSNVYGKRTTNLFSRIEKEPFSIESQITYPIFFSTKLSRSKWKRKKKKKKKKKKRMVPANVLNWLYRNELSGS